MEQDANAYMKLYNNIMLYYKKVWDMRLIAVLGAQLAMCFQSSLQGSLVWSCCLCLVSAVCTHKRAQSDLKNLMAIHLYGYSLLPRGVDLYEGVATTIPFPCFGRKFNIIRGRLTVG